MSLSDILEILAMSRLIAICTGSPAEGMKCFSREKGSVEGTVKPFRMLRRVGTVLSLTVTKTAEAHRVRHSFRALGSQIL